MGMRPRFRSLATRLARRYGTIVVDYSTFRRWVGRDGPAALAAAALRRPDSAASVLRWPTSAAGAAELAVADRWFPSSKTTTAAAATWPISSSATGGGYARCGEPVDRDVNPACNILVAAELSETQTVCGGSVSRGQSLAVPVKQEPAEAPRERRGRNPAHGGEEVNTTSFAPPVRLGSRHR